MGFLFWKKKNDQLHYAPPPSVSTTTVPRPSPASIITTGIGRISSSKPDLEIDTERLRAAANSIRTSNEKMLQNANTIYTTINNLESDWDSSVQKDFATRAKKSNEVYQHYHALLDNVAYLMEAIADEYEKHEKKIVRASQDSF